MGSDSLKERGERMQPMRLMFAMAVVMTTGVAMGQAPAAPAGPTGPAAEVQRSYATFKTNILKSADKMPEAATTNGALKV